MTTSRSDYSLLAIAAALYIAGVFYYQSTPRTVLLATIIFCLVYIGWGIMHHLHSKNFHARIVLEYLLIGLMGLVIVSSLLV